MKSFARHWIINVLALMALTVFFPTALIAADMPIWANDAYAVRSSASAPQHTTISPNRKFIAKISRFRLTVLHDHAELAGLKDEGVIQPAELLWARDSKRFFINEDDGGTTGTWTVIVYDVNSREVSRFDVTKNVLKRVQNLYPCDTPEIPNIAAIGWINRSDSLAVIAQVPPHSSCPQMGKYVGYLISIPSGQILREITEPSALIEAWSKYMAPSLLERVKLAMKE